MTGADPAAPQLTERLVIQRTEFSMRLESLILRTKPYVLYRWLVCGGLYLLFILRMVLGHRYYTIGYVGGLYFLNCLVLFVSPKLDPEVFSSDVLPSAGDGDYKPFVRKLPEFIFWRRSFNAALIGHIASLFRFLDPPVYGPLLLVYFVIVVVFNFRARIAHMIKNRYLPFETNKPRFAPGDK
jgi:hypothetical protein